MRVTTDLLAARDALGLCNHRVRVVAAEWVVCRSITNPSGNTPNEVCSWHHMAVFAGRTRELGERSRLVTVPEHLVATAGALATNNLAMVTLEVLLSLVGECALEFVMVDTNRSVKAGACGVVSRLPGQVFLGLRDFCHPLLELDIEMHLAMLACFSIRWARTCRAGATAANMCPTGTSGA